MTPFERSLQFTLTFEGGFVNDPDDHGGATYQGVTQRVYDSYRRTHNRPTQTVKLISDSEVKELYEADYWAPAGCRKLAPNLAAVTFDFAVHSGVHRAVVTLQHIVGVIGDGHIGPKTLAAIALHDEHELIGRYLDERRRHLKALAVGTQEKYLKGWLNRVKALGHVVGH
jgi:lysozyme family protein